MIPSTAWQRQNEKGSAGALPLSGADWLLVNRQTTISDASHRKRRELIVKVWRQHTYL
jgi:hypothetical protein